MAKKILDTSTKEELDKVIHDLKTPLTNIRTFSHLLEKQLETKGDGDLVKYASKIQSNIDRANTLINNFAHTVQQILKDKKDL